MANIGKVNYKNSIVNFSSSLMKYYGLSSSYPSHALTDYLLSRKYRHVAVILLDGMGYQIVEDDLSNGSVFKTHQIMKLNSVFPPTTAAAVTALQTGKAPIESGWLGWHEYLNDEDPSLILFQNKVYKTGEDFTKFNVQDLVPTQPFYTGLKRAKSYNIGPSFAENPCETFDEAILKLKEILNKDETNFTYLYWDDPDKTIHEYGVNSSVTKVLLHQFEEKIEQLGSEIPDNTIIFVLADHGLIDVEPFELKNYPDFKDTLRKDFAGEGRCAQFYVKQNRKEEFKELFNKYFGEYFDLYSKDEILKAKLFGTGNPHHIIKYAMGDFTAIAKDIYFFVEEVNENTFKAAHAGLTKEELEVPVIMFRRKDEKEG